MKSGQGFIQSAQNTKKICRHVVDLEPQKIFGLRQHDQHRNAVGETNDHRDWNEPDQGAQFEQAHDKQQHARCRGGKNEICQAVAFQDAIHNDNEGTRWAANLNLAAAQSRNDEAGNDGSEQASFGLES